MKKCSKCNGELEVHEYLSDDTKTTSKWGSAYYCEECDEYQTEEEKQ